MNGYLESTPRGRAELLDVVRRLSDSTTESLTLTTSLRRALVESLESMLALPGLLREHTEHVRALYPDAVPPTEALSPARIEHVRAEGVAGLEDREIARLYLDPVAIYHLRDWLRLLDPASRLPQPGRRSDR